MLLYTIALEGDYITFVGEIGTPEDGFKQSYRNSSIKELISRILDDNLSLIHQGGNTSSYDYTEVEDPNTPGLAFTSLDTFRTYLTANSIAEGGFTPIDGSGTTVNGSAIDLGGTLSSSAILNIPNSSYFKIVNQNSYNNFEGDVVNHYLENPFDNSTHNFTLDYNNFTIDMYENTVGHSLYIDATCTTAFSRYYMSVGSGANVHTIRLMDTIGINLELPASGGILAMTNLPSGATQVAAGTSINQLWVTVSHATLPDGVIMIGL